MWLRAKGERGFLPGLEKNTRADRGKGPDWSYVWFLEWSCEKVNVWPSVYWSVIKYAWTVVGACVSPALSHDSVLLPIVRLHPWLLLRPLPCLCGAGLWCTPVKTLSHSLVTEQHSWGWNKLRSWHENMQWGTLPWPRASTSRVCHPSA